MLDISCKNGQTPTNPVHFILWKVTLFL